LRRFTILAAGVVIAVGTLAGCIGGPPPPPPTDPHDVLTVGDSVSFSFGCALGDDGGSPADGCPARPGYTTHNEYSGACTIIPGDVLLYNGGSAPAPNCNTSTDEQGRTWEEAANFFVPKVVVINTAGWEVVDRWIEQSRGSSTPDAQWGGSTGSGTPYQQAAVYYSYYLKNAVDMFRSKGAKVLIAETPYFDPPEPVPPPSQVGPDFACSWWEPYDPTPPTAGGECAGTWTPPYPGVTYRSSKNKADQLNGIVQQVKDQYYPNDANVVLFNFKKHFNGPSNVYTSYVCPPPYDYTVAPDASNNCQTPQGTVAAILARTPDNGHLTVAGTFNILQPYLESCVKNLLNIGGSASDCT
jgi:hypothetical protein